MSTHATFSRKHKRDVNHGPIAERLEELGASVRDMSKVGNDFPDLIVGFCSRDFLVEVKAPKGKVSDGQSEFARDWRGAPVVVLRSVDEAQAWYLSTRAHLTRRDQIRAALAVKSP